MCMYLKVFFGVFGCYDMLEKGKKLMVWLLSFSFPKDLGLVQLLSVCCKLK